MPEGTLRQNRSPEQAPPISTSIANDREKSLLSACLILCSIRAFNISLPLFQFSASKFCTTNVKCDLFAACWHRRYSSGLKIGARSTPVGPVSGKTFKDDFLARVGTAGEAVRHFDFLSPIIWPRINDIELDKNMYIPRQNDLSWKLSTYRIFQVRWKINRRFN